MKRLGRIRDDETPGQDSFLDIVANLVGILIILIIVVGARATHAMVEAAKEEKPAAEVEAVDVETPKAAALAVEADIQQIGGKLQRQQIEIEYRRKERDKMMTLMSAIQQQIEQERSKLDQSSAQRFDVQRNIASAQQQLHELVQRRHFLETVGQQTKVIEHLPTPMAKTVFGKELHFRLEHGKVTYVPMDELVERLKSELPSKVWKLKETPRITETIGPIDDFWLKYAMQRTERVVETRMGPHVQKMVELDRFILVPVADDLGESISSALQPNSVFNNILQQHDPNNTTITIWVYPSSFNDFRTLKAALFDRGYLTAGRPLPEGHPIGGSPQGSRSAVQ